MRIVQQILGLSLICSFKIMIVSHFDLKHSKIGKKLKYDRTIILKNKIHSNWVYVVLFSKFFEYNNFLLLFKENPFKMSKSTTFWDSRNRFSMSHIRRWSRFQRHMFFMSKKIFFFIKWFFDNLKRGRSSSAEKMKNSRSTEISGRTFRR